MGFEQGVRAVGRDGPRSIPINGACGSLWLSLGAPMAVLGSGAGAGSAGQHAGEDNRGPGRCDSVGAVGSLVDGSGAVGAVRPGRPRGRAGPGRRRPRGPGRGWPPRSPGRWPPLPDVVGPQLDGANRRPPSRAAPQALAPGDDLGRAPQQVG